MGVRKLWLVVLFLSVPALAQDVISSYPKVVARIQAPPAKESISIVCQKKIDSGYVSFLAADRKTPILVAFTSEKLKDPERKISFKPLFFFPKNGPLFVMEYGTLKDWAYIFDRNGDGKVDYVAFVVGPGAVERDKPVPADFPKDGKGIKREHAHWLIENATLMFAHWADDNFDGRVDVAVYDAFAAGTNLWTDHNVLVRSSHADGKLDQAYEFKTDISKPVTVLQPSPSGAFPVRAPGLHGDEVTPAEFDSFTAFLSQTNKALEQCKLRLAQ